MTTTAFISLHILANSPSKKTLSVTKFDEYSERKRKYRALYPSMVGEDAWHVGLFQFSSSNDGSQS